MWRAAIVAITIMLAACQNVSGTIRPDAWADYRNRFISAEGRVVDNGNGNISHSEGQGYAMLLAVAADDRKTFERLWSWTRQHLAVRPDGLFAWKWSPDHAGSTPDKNNATDGDLLIAWALGRASRQFGVASYGESATALAKAIRTRLARESDYGVLLLPGAAGFEKNSGIVINPSYIILPAYRELARWESPEFWNRLETQNRSLLNTLMLHFDGLPPDWVMLSGRHFLKADLADLRFGYDALRVPLYVCWQGDEKQVSLDGIAKRWSRISAPSWVSLDNKSVAKEPLSDAHLAMRWLLARSLPHAAWTDTPELPKSSTNYYDATLTLLAELAWSERND